MLKVHDRPGTDPDGPADGGLTARQEAVAALLAGGATQAEASRRARVGTTTLKRWAKEPAFAKRVGDLRTEATTAAVGRLVASMTSAADTLGYLARKGKQEAVRLAAARSVLELGLKMREGADLADRVAELEGRSPPTAAGRRSA